MGKLRAFQHHGIVPDLLVTGKGITGGCHPCGALSFAAALGRFDRAVAELTDDLGTVARLPAGRAEAAPAPRVMAEPVRRLSDSRSAGVLPARRIEIVLHADGCAVLEEGRDRRRRRLGVAGDPFGAYPVG